MIKVTDRFYINASTNCYILQEKTTVQDVKSQNYGQEIFKELGYYTTIENCLKGILKITTREFIAQEQENNIKDLLKEIKSQNEFLKSLKVEV